MRQQYRNTEKKGKTQYQKPNTNPRVQVKAKCIHKILRCLELRPVNCLVAVGWDYILAAKIFHPKRKSQHR